MSLRTAREQYVKRNGFDEYTKRFPTEDLNEAEATEAQDVARFVIREMGSFFPSLDEMKKEVDTPETIASITERIKRLKREHQDSMAKLSRYYVQELYDDAMDRYFQTDDIKYFDFEDFTKSTDEWARHYARLEVSKLHLLFFINLVHRVLKLNDLDAIAEKSFFKQSGQILTSEHNDLVARMQYDHLRELLPLYARRRELEKSEEMRRIRRTAQFPQSIDEYRRMDRKDAKLLVARFLMADDSKRESMRTQSQWAWRQTEPLIQEFKSNEGFQGEIAKFVSENESRDPRARRGGG